MVLGNRARSVRAVISASVLACTLASVAWAGRDFTPQAGTWIVSEELNGKPGRGLAIDVQGNTFFMQVFAYEKNGDATFYLATGQMDGNRDCAADALPRRAQFWQRRARCGRGQIAGQCDGEICQRTAGDGAVSG